MDDARIIKVILELVTILSHVYNSVMFVSLIVTRIPVYLAIVVHFFQSLLLFFFSHMCTYGPG